MHTIRIADRDVHMTDEQSSRFHTKYRKSDGCHLWQYALDREGYGMHKVGKTNMFRAHRVAYMLAHGPIPSDQQLDHLCRTPSCVNPDHLEPVTPRENTQRSIRVAAPHCRNGHDRTPENTYTTPAGFRGCRPCRAIATRRWRDRTPAA